MRQNKKSPAAGDGAGEVRSGTDHSPSADEQQGHAVLKVAQGYRDAGFDQQTDAERRDHQKPFHCRSVSLRWYAIGLDLMRASFQSLQAFRKPG